MLEAQHISKLNELINLFEYNINQYKGKNYDEAKTRVDFIDKFFSLLGWDIDNTQGYSEQYREVVREDRVTIKGKVKAPDYCFRIGSERKFFVEAKKPSIDIKHDIGPAFQLRRYAYTSKLPLSILTDFEEFAVYDTRIKPGKSDKASTARIFYCTYKDYPGEIDFITNTFSKQAILKGSFDKYIEDNKRKKGTSEVDKEFLKLIEKWREDLAKNIALRNKNLSIYELNYVVQAIIDRIIFLRIAEDRHMEPYGRIQHLLEIKKSIYPELVKLFLQADVKYNSGLFDFSKDEISPHLTIDDRVFKDIIKYLYYPDSPYEFSVLAVEILGNIYEQFLGKTIRLTPAHQAKVEDKPEVKKAGGVYYTPKYIVDYIVRHTVGEKIKDKKPEDITKIKILDPACGSGSFLLGAYQLLLDFHLNYYTGGHADKKLSSANKQQTLLNKALKENRIYQVGEGEYRLTIEEKHNILLNNIFGVDIDRQAVEVTKLSLLLKLLEGESMESTGLLFKYSDIKLLPDLSGNIKCGNSLIGSDFYEKGQRSLFPDEETVRRINVFDWEKEFLEIFQQGGFDVVIGNPPYVVITKDIFPEEVIDYYNQYSVAQYKMDLFNFFVEKGISILKPSGLLGCIVPNQWLTQKYTNKLRRYILEYTKVIEIFVFDYPVFRSVNVYTALVFFEKNKLKNNHNIKIINSFREDDTKNLESIPISYVPQKMWLNTEDFRFETKIIGEKGELVKKIKSGCKSLIEVARASLGCQAYNRSKHSLSEISNRIFHSKFKVGDDYLPELAGKDVSRYLIDRKKGEWIKYGPWLHDYRTLDWLQGPRILIREISGPLPYRIHACYVEETFCNYKTILNVNPSTPTNFSMKYLLGLINSKLFSYLYPLISNKMVARGFPRITVGDLKVLPIRAINFSNKDEKSQHDRIAELVDHMLEMQKKYHSAKIETEKSLFKKQIDILNYQIDQLVYQLYQLTDDEIKIIEQDTGEKR